MLTALFAGACGPMVAEAPSPVARVAPDTRPESLLAAIAGLPTGIMTGNVELVGKPPSELYGLGSFTAADDALTDEAVSAKVRPVLAELLAGAPREVVQLGARRFSTAPHIKVFVYDPVVRKGLAFVQIDKWMTGSSTYVLEWRGGEWVALARRSGPVF